ncbi:MAG: hypothetical protein QOF60_1262 [Actinomycetota bacterium]|jgi:hypothetical protein|nr:hypothetical protein [Actinomycetota bacterium]
MPELDAVFVGDPAPLWASLGFTIDDDGCVRASGVRFVLGAESSSIGGFRAAGDTPIEDEHPHPNGVVALDHVVLTTPDLGRTIADLEGQGHELRRTRDTGTDARPMRQAFFKAGPVVLEVVGPRTSTGDGPTRFWGLAWTVADLDATAAYLGERLRPPKTAVQPGRRIATLDRAAGSTVPMAFMSR